MFGKKLRKTCQYCEMELPLLGDVCAYCGQKQSKAAWQEQWQSQSQDKKQHEFHVPVSVPPVSSISKTTTMAGPVLPPPPHKPVAGQPHTIAKRENQFKRPLQTPARATANTQATTPHAVTASSASAFTKLMRFASFGVWLWSFALVITHFMTPSYEPPLYEWTPVVCTLAAFVFFVSSQRSLFLNFIAAIILPLSAFFLLTKPGAAPISYDILEANGQNATYAYDYGAEIHLYYILPGVILGLLSFLSFLLLFKRTTQALMRFLKV